MGTIVFEAPDDVFVQEIVTSGQVPKGQKIIVFRSPDLDRTNASLQSLLDHIKIIERPLNDGRVDDEIKALNSKASILKDASDSAKMSLDKDWGSHMPTVGPYKPWTDMVMASAQAQSAYLDAQLSASHAERKKLDLLDKIATAKNKLAREQDYLTAMTGGLTILSPDAGNFTAHVSTGAFLKKGQIAGELLK